MRKLGLFLMMILAWSFLLKNNIVCCDTNLDRDTIQIIVFPSQHYDLGDTDYGIEIGYNEDRLEIITHYENENILITTLLNTLNLTYEFDSKCDFIGYPKSSRKIVVKKSNNKDVKISIGLCLKDNNVKLNISGIGYYVLGGLHKLTNGNYCFTINIDDTEKLEEFNTALGGYGIFPSAIDVHQ